MARFKFSVAGQFLDLLTPYKGISDSVNANWFDFDFRSPEWDRMEKWAHFSSPDYNNGEEVDFNIVDDMISPERGINLPAGVWEIYVHGSYIQGEEVIQRLVTNTQTFCIEQSGIIENNVFSSLAKSDSEKAVAMATEAYNGRITTALADIVGGYGEPTVDVSITGADRAKVLNFVFHNLVGNGIAAYETAQDGTITVTFSDGSTSVYTGLADLISDVNDYLENVIEQNESVRQAQESQRQVHEYGENLDGTGGRVGNEATRIANEEARIALYNKISAIISTGTGSSSVILNNLTGWAANVASAQYSYAEGTNTGATGFAAHAEGNDTIASGRDSHAEGISSTASGSDSHAEGNTSTASGAASHAEGGSTVASGDCSHAEGEGALASGRCSHAEGIGGTYQINETTYTSGAKSVTDHAEGYKTIADSGNAPTGYGSGAHAEGTLTRAQSVASHAEGKGTVASGNFSHTEGYGTRTEAENPYDPTYENRQDADTDETTFRYYGAHAEGFSTKASGGAAHSEGKGTVASGHYSHAEGLGGSYTEGNATTVSGAKGACDHSEGCQTVADSGADISEDFDGGAHAEGSHTKATNRGAHAEGRYTVASGRGSHAEGICTIANRAGQHVFGEYNIQDSNGNPDLHGDYIEIVGNGTYSERSNARTLDWDGNEVLAGNLTAAGGSITVGQTTFTENQLTSIMSGTSSSGSSNVVAVAGRATVYCWGDSLTEGVGAYVMQPDNRNAYMAYSYPAWLGQSFDVVNLGARGEDIHAIMARQGADPIVIQTSFTIPASADTPVKIGELSRMLTYGAGTGFTSKSGALVKVCKEVESPGLNPCVIADVEGIIYRELKSSTDDNTTYDYYFRRLEDGTATTVPVGTEVETYAMRNYRNGYAVIWMGANGGYTSHQDFASKVLEMVEYGNYNDYIVILAREFAAQWVSDIKTLLTDEMGVCHVIYLMDQLPYRGYAMAGISSNNIDTSNWVTTDPIKKYAPLLCDYNGSLQSDEDKYGGLHFSAWGYKAIAKLVQEKLMPMIKAAEISGGGSGGNTPVSTTGTDNYGTYLYKLPAPRTFNGATYLNTKIKLFEDLTESWTVVCKYSGVVSCDDGYPCNILCCTPDGSNQGILVRYTSASDAMVVLGVGAFPLGPTYSNNTEVNFDQTNVMVLIKTGSDYKFYCNNTVCAYGMALNYALSDDKAHSLPLIFGARWNSSGDAVNYRTKFTLEDARVYDSALTDADVMDLYDELTT